MRIESLSFANIFTKAGYTDSFSGMVFAQANLFSLAWASMIPGECFAGSDWWMCIVLAQLSSPALECLSPAASLNKTPGPVGNRGVSTATAVRSP